MSTSVTSAVLGGLLGLGAVTAAAALVCGLVLLGRLAVRRYQRRRVRQDWQCWLHAGGEPPLWWSDEVSELRQREDQL